MTGSFRIVIVIVARCVGAGDQSGRLRRSGAGVAGCSLEPAQRGLEPGGEALRVGVELGADLRALRPPPRPHLRGIGAGHAVTALYALRLRDEVGVLGRIATVRVRWTDPERGSTEELVRDVRASDLARSFAATDPYFRFDAVVAAITGKTTTKTITKS